MRKGRVTKADKEKMRNNIVSEKIKRKKKTIVIDSFCVAYMKLVQDPPNGMYEKCQVEDKSPDGCHNCFYNRKKKRWV